MKAYRNVYRTIDLHDGLASMFVLTLHQDADGIIWAGTYNGLSLLGGNNSEVIFPQHPHIKALAGSIVENIQSTDEGMLWIQNNFGMHLWNRVTGELEHHPEAQGGNRCAVSSKGDVVVFTSRRGFLFYNHVAHLFQPLDIESESYSDCRHLSLDSLGRLTLYTSVERVAYQLNPPAADGIITAQLLSRERHPMGRIHYALSSGSDFFYTPSCCAFTHRVAFEEGSVQRVLLKSGPGNRGRSACGTTPVAHLEFPCADGLILRCAGKAGNPFQTTQGNRHSCRHQEGRRGSDEVVSGPSVFPSRELGVSGKFWGSHERSSLLHRIFST